MNIGFLGLGKLGLPCALAIESKGHSVIGYDISKNVQEIVKKKKLPYKEVGAQELLDKSNIKITPLSSVVRHSEIMFVSIQTPHEKLYEGITRIPEDRIDFNYEWLKRGIKTLSDEIEKQAVNKVVVLISTVLPGTIEREIKPLLNSHVQLCYNPFFIAMGTTIKDFLNPEFVLFGVDNEFAAKKAEFLYKTIHTKPFFKTTIENAELIKVAYNTFIGMKIVYANTMMEICHKTGANIDNVTDAIKFATDRLISDKYLSGGMGDGGGCHPRDNIALSWLARELNLSHDFFEDMMLAREHQTEWLADLIQEKSKGLKVFILGKSFKPETNIQTGSPSILLRNILEEREINVTMYDPYIDADSDKPNDKGVYFIGTKHQNFIDYDFPHGSIVIDPWRYISNKDNIEVIRIGE